MGVSPIDRLNASTTREGNLSSGVAIRHLSEGNLSSGVGPLSGGNSSRTVLSSRENLNSGAVISVRT